MHLFQFRRSSKIHKNHGREGGKERRGEGGQETRGRGGGEVALNFQLVSRTTGAATTAHTHKSTHTRAHTPEGGVAEGLVIIDDDGEESDRWGHIASAIDAANSEVEDEFPELSVRALEFAELRCVTARCNTLLHWNVTLCSAL